MNESRYDRQERVQGWNQQALNEATVLVVGAGALGNEAIKNLALLGVGHLQIIDFDRIELSNLSRTVLFRPHDVGRSKAEIAAQRARELNPEIEVQCFNGDVFYDVGLGFYRHANLVIGCLDNIAARSQVGRCCALAGTPYLDGGMWELGGEVRWFLPGETACFECTLTETDRLHAQQRWSCTGFKPDESAVDRRVFPATVQTAAIIGGLLAQEATRLLCGWKVTGGEADGTIAYFEYLLTRFTEPNEIFGPVNVKAFQAGEGQHRLTKGHLPKAEIAFLDEVFKSNSAILNSLLNILNERVFYNGDKVEPVPLLCAIGATNEIPDDTTLSALYDRFVVRMWTDNVDDARFGELLSAGWALEKDRIQQGYQIKVKPSLSTDTLAAVHRALEQVNLDSVLNAYHEAIRRIRSEGIEVSDRRAIKLLKLIGSAALMRQSLEANTCDFWVLAHVWNNPEQIPHLQAIIEPYLEGCDSRGWVAERSLKDIDAEINVLKGTETRLRTDADYKDFLQRAERLRQELSQHSDQESARKSRGRLDALIESAMKKLDQLD